MIDLQIGLMALALGIGAWSVLRWILRPSGKQRRGARRQHSHSRSAEQNAWSDSTRRRRESPGMTRWPLRPR
jgi:hypothetical protein